MTTTRRPARSPISRRSGLSSCTAKCKSEIAIRRTRSRVACRVSDVSTRCPEWLPDVLSLDHAAWSATEVSVPSVPKLVMAGVPPLPVGTARLYSFATAAVRPAHRTTTSPKAAKKKSPKMPNLIMTTPTTTSAIAVDFKTLA